MPTFQGCIFCAVFPKPLSCLETKKAAIGSLIYKSLYKWCITVPFPSFALRVAYGYGQGLILFLFLLYVPFVMR